MKKLLTIYLLIATTFTVNAQEELDLTNLDHWIILIENTTIDNVKTIMSQLNYNLETEKSSGSKDELVFEHSKKERIAFIYENKKLKTLASAVFVMTLPIMLDFLEDQGYTITSKKKIKKDNQTKEVITWDKPNRLYKFVFSEANDFQSILEIKIDESAVNESAVIDLVNLENMPPIQIFLDKIAGKEFVNESKEKNVSQLLTNNTFTRISIHSSSGNAWKREVKKIAWKNFKRVETYTLKNTDKYIYCYFYFDTNLNNKIFLNDVEFDNYDKYNYFECFIYAKDKEAFLKVIKDWENSRN